MNRQITPNAASGSRRHGPLAATSPIAAASPTAVPYSATAGCADCDHGTRFARKVATGTEAANIPATRHHLARRLRLSSAAPQNASPIPAITAVSASAYVQKNSPWEERHTCSAASRATSDPIVAASVPRSPLVICAPTTPDGTARPSQPSTVGVRSVSTTMPGCLVEAAPSRPAR